MAKRFHLNEQELELATIGLRMYDECLKGSIQYNQRMVELRNTPEFRSAYTATCQERTVVQALISKFNPPMTDEEVAEELPI